MSGTRRIYNRAKQWFKVQITSWADGYEDGMFSLRHWGLHPYKQYDTFHCHCSWCRPKSYEHGSLRVQHKAEIRRELANL